MGSNKSTLNKPCAPDTKNVVRTMGDETAAQRRIMSQLEAEKLQWQRQQQLEQHWRENKLREELRRMEAEQAWKWQQEQQSKEQRAQKCRLQEHKSRTPQSQQQQLQTQQPQQPKLQTQTARLPKLQTQTAQLPKLQNQTAQLPKLQTQTAQLPKLQTQSAQRPKLQTQQAPQPKLHIVKVGVPELATHQLPQQPARLPKSIVKPQEASSSQKILSAIEPKQNIQETYLSRMRASGISFVEWSIIEYIQEQNSISENIAARVLELLDDGNTVPFIGTYRKGATQGLSVGQVRKIKNSYDVAKLIKKQAVSIVNEVSAKGNWTPEFHAFVHESKSICDLEYIHSIYKVTGVTPVSKAKDLGLGKIAEAVMQGKDIEPLCYLEKQNIEGLKNEEQLKAGIVCIIADMITNDKRSLGTIKNLKSRFRIIIETKVKGANPEVHKENMKKYQPYVHFKTTVNNLETSQISTIVQGEAEKALNVRIIIPQLLDRAFRTDCMLLYKSAANVSPLHESLISQAIDSMYEKSIKPYIRKWTKQEMKERAETASMEIIAQNVLLLVIAESEGLGDEKVNAAVSAVRNAEEPIDMLIKMQKPSILNEHSMVKLEGVIMDAISSVGIDLNLTMPTSVLKRLPGLNEEKAKNIVKFRTAYWPLTRRHDLLKVKGINDKTFEQCAGFVKIMPDPAIYPDGNRVESWNLNYLDQTTIHPESYDVAEAFLKAANCSIRNLGTKAFAFAVKLYAGLGTATLAKKFGTTEDVIDSVVKGFMMEKPTIGDVNNDIPAVPRSKVRFDDLQIGTFLTGVVRNVNRFGVFVDVGAERDGLIIERFMGGMTLSSGQIVETRVNSVEKDRRRFGLTLIKCL